MKCKLFIAICLLCLLFAGCETPEKPIDENGTSAPATVTPAPEEPSSGGPATDKEPVTEVPADDKPLTPEPAYPEEEVITDIVAASGSAHDIQVAADTIKAAGGGTVHIPEGDFLLDGSVTIRSNVSLIGAGKDKTTLRTKGTSMVIQAKGENIRISGFSLISANNNGGGNGITVDNCVNFRIDHLYIEGYFNQAGINVSGRDARGVIDHCEITINPGSELGYAIVVYRDDFWEENMRLGTKYAVFIEDNTFVNARHAVAANKGAHYVFRHNLVKQGTISQALDAHGPYWGSTEGTRAVEIYGNVIEDPEPDGSERAIGIRGGGGVIFDNIIRGYEYGVMLIIEDKQDLRSYPIYHQVHDLYIWNNTCNSTEVIVQNENRARGYIKEDRDFYLHAKPGYKPYRYPHPLTKEVNLDDQDPAINLVLNLISTRYLMSSVSD